MSELHATIQNVLSQQQAVYTSQVSSVLYDVYTNILKELNIYDEHLSHRNEEILKNSPQPEMHLSLEQTRKLMSNVLCFGCMTILNYNDFHNVLADAISIEMTMDTLSDVERARKRKDLSAVSSQDVYYIDYGVSDFSFDVWTYLFNSLSQSLDDVKSSGIIKTLDSSYEVLSDKQLATLRLLCNNYGYLLRAFYNNHLFARQILDMARKFRMEYLC